MKFYDSIIDYKAEREIEKTILQFQKAKYELFMAIVEQFKIDKITLWLDKMINKIMW